MSGVDFNFGRDFDPVRATASVLARAISEFSEETYCAGWLTWIEYQLWDEIHAPEPAAADVGMSRASSGDLRLTDRERAFFRGLSSALGGGWVMWQDHGADYDLLEEQPEHQPLAGSGVVLVLAEEWATKHAEWARMAREWRPAS